MDKYAVIGHPIAHSVSPMIHQEFAKQTQQDISYEKILAPLDGFREAVFKFRDEGGKGLNVTLPFKIAAYNLADKLSDHAKASGAVNTLKFMEDGTLFADNTDGPGLMQDITHNHDYCCRQKKILVIGAGGTAREVVCALTKHAPAQIVIANRTKQKAVDIADHFRLNGEIIGKGLDEFDNGPYDLIINASSAGITGDFPELPLNLISNNTWIYDIVYGENDTSFIRWAKQGNPKKCLNGYGMLVEQAALSFYLWRGVYPQTKAVIEKLVPHRKSADQI